MGSSKEPVKMSIATDVLSDGSFGEESKIVTQRTDGSVVTLTSVAVITKAGMTFIRRHGLKLTSSRNGLLATGANMESGNEHGKT